MIRSMTGFARRERQGPWGSLTCELRTVNHRYLEMSLRLPDELRALEQEIRQTIAGALRRGKVDITLSLKSGPSAARALEINDDLLTQLLGTLQQVSSRIGVTSVGSAIDILRWPGVVRESELATQPLMTASLELLRESSAELNETRAREGHRIREILLQRSESIRVHVQAVKARLPEVSQRVRARILERIAQANLTPDTERLEQELVLFANRMDVDEELERLQSHLQEVAATLNGTEPAGRRLDFLMQELNREANTLSSKSQDSDTTRAAVDMKVLIEQMREQVQNVE